MTAVWIVFSAHSPYALVSTLWSQTVSISPSSNLRSPIHSKVLYTTTMVRGDKVHLPPQLSGFKVGQRVFFAMRDGEIRIHPKPVRVVGGRLLSSRVRHAVRSHAMWGPRKRVQ